MVDGPEGFNELAASAEEGERCGEGGESEGVLGVLESKWKGIGVLGRVVGADRRGAGGSLQYELLLLALVDVEKDVADVVVCQGCLAWHGQYLWSDVRR